MRTNVLNTGPESAQPFIVVNEFPVSDYTIDSGGSVQGGAIQTEFDRIAWR